MKIVIVGGGTAGWLTTFIMSKIRPKHEYINISSDEISTVGVGEGITGLFRSILSDPFYEINEYDFFVKTKAVPKLSIKFSNWTNKKDYFYHPIEGSITAPKFVDTSLFYSILKNYDINDCSKTGYLSNRDKSNFIIKNNNIEFYEYGLHAYHIDNVETGKYFKNLCQKNNVTCINSKIEKVITENNKIISVSLTDGKIIEADFFVDCSGFYRMLSKHLNTDIVSYEKYLPLNESIIFSVDNDNEKAHPYTNANAMNNGWMFEIFKHNTTGRGYSYCNNFCSEEQAVIEIIEYFNKQINVIKKINFHSNRLKNAFTGNCLSVGLSNFSVEPLQASGIHCALVQINDFMRNCFDDDIKAMTNSVVIKKYNERTAKLCDDLVDFIMVHYTGGKTDTEFWKYITYEKPVSNKVNEILELCKTRLTRWDDFDTYYGCTNQILWNSTLAGLGHFKKETILKIFDTWNIEDEYIEHELQDHYSKMSSVELQSSNICEINKFLKEV
jgi:hypothetical protein